MNSKLVILIVSLIVFTACGKAETNGATALDTHTNPCSTDYLISMDQIFKDQQKVEHYYDDDNQMSVEGKLNYPEVKKSYQAVNADCKNFLPRFGKGNCTTKKNTGDDWAASFTDAIKQICDSAEAELQAEADENSEIYIPRN